MESTVLTICVRDLGYATEHLRIDLALPQFVISPCLLCASVSREKGGGRRRWGYRSMQSIVVCACGDQLVTLKYFVCTILEIGSRAVPSESQVVLLFVGAFSAVPTFVIYYPAYEAGLNFGLSLVWMVQFG